MNTVRMILCGNVEDSRMNPSEKVGVVSVVFVSTEEEKIKNKLKKLQDKNPEKFYCLQTDIILHIKYVNLRQQIQCLLLDILLIFQHIFQKKGIHSLN